MEPSSRPPSHQPLDGVLWALSLLSSVASVVAIVVNQVSTRSGPEFNTHEIVLLFLTVAQFGVFVLAVIYSVLAAGSQSGLRLSRSTAGMAVVAIILFVVEMFVLNP